jgi:hypothetical protein
VLGHLDDLASDFSAIHRVDDIYALPGPAFFRFAFRLGAYQGVIQARMAEQQAGQAPDDQQGADGQRIASGTRESLEQIQAKLNAAAPGAPNLFSFGTFSRIG